MVLTNTSQHRTIVQQHNLTDNHHNILLIENGDEMLNHFNSHSKLSHLSIIKISCLEDCLRIGKSNDISLILIASDFEGVDPIELASNIQHPTNKSQKVVVFGDNLEIQQYDKQSLSLSHLNIEIKEKNPEMLTYLIQNHFLNLKINALSKQDQNKISSMSQLLARKSLSHMQSIEYAKLIQNRILPKIDKIESRYSNSFVIYEPKEIIGGDFYMFAEINSRIIIVSADCTGHGVPGAMLSMVGYGYIKSIIHENRIVEPGAILTLLNQKIRNFFGQDNAVGTHGMDISVCSYRLDTKTFEYGSSKRPLFLSEGNDLIELKGDSYSIGDEASDNFVFQTYTYPISGPFWLYQFSDGVTDQFGGERNKKFGKRRLKDLLKSLQDRKSKDQKELLLDALINWKGIQKQTDDITLIGKYFEH